MNAQNIANTNVSCNLKQAEKAILDIEEVKNKNKLINSLSSHKEGISFMSDSLNLNGKRYYEIQVGYNGKMRFESYYTFYVEVGEL